MPELSRFLNIKILMYADEHNPPHLHAWHKEYRAVFTFDGDMIKGYLPRRERLAVQTWIEYHREELAANWRRLEDGEAPCKIDPLEI